MYFKINIPDIRLIVRDCLTFVCLFVSSQEPTHYDADPVLIQEDMSVMTDYELHRLCWDYGVLTPYRLDKELILSSGKFQMLDQLLPKLKEEVNYVIMIIIVGSKFTQIMHICLKLAV